MSSPVDASSMIQSIDDPPVDFMSVSLLSRPSDHFTIQNERKSSTSSSNNASSGSGNPSNPYQPPPRRKQPITPHQFASRFIQDPVNTTLSSFSKVANLFLAANDEYESAIDDLISSRSEQRQQEPEPAHILEPYCPPPPALPLIPCSNPQRRLEKFTDEQFEKELSTASTKDILTRVFLGGIAENSLRRKLWPLILGLTDDWKNFDWTEKDALFNHYSNQWQSILPDQESRFTSYRERKSIAERDVIRCDRNHPFYFESTGNLDKLKCLLLSYVMYDFDTGYVQGMTDLASPLLWAYDGQVDKAFWIFVQVMELFRKNFEMSQKTISSQLTTLWKLIKLTDPVFADFLKSRESDNCYFAFRWIICLFKREFMKGKTDGYDDCLLVWETVWAATALRSISGKKKSPSTINSCEEDSSALLMENGENGNNCNGSNGVDEKTARLSQDNNTSAPAIDGNNTDDLIDVRSPSITPTQESPLSASPPTRHSSNDQGANGSTDSTENIQAFYQDESTGHNATHLSSTPTIELESQQCNDDNLSDVQLFVLCICLSIIRRERDQLMTKKYDAPEILKHFNTLNLNGDLNHILQHASTIWYWLKEDGGEEQLNAPEVLDDKRHDSSNDDFDLLSDEFMLVTTMNV